MAPKRRTRIDIQDLRERMFAKHVPGEALTKEQHDEIVARKGRPLTQDPIGSHPHPHPSVEGPS